MSREAMQMALDALENNPATHAGLISRKQAITTLRQALVDADDTSQERVDETVKSEHEPVAWISDSPTKGNGKQLHWTKSEAWRWSSNITPLYTAPKQWVGLTDYEIQDLSYLSQKIDASNSEWFDRLEFARAIEAKLKEKNT
jgi:hypothetical protein